MKARHDRTPRLPCVPVRRWAGIVSGFRPQFARHRRGFLLASLSALIVVGTRLALPWSLRALVEPWMAAPTGAPTGLLSMEMSGLALAFLGLVALLGFADYRLRLHYARFAIGFVRDVRADCFRAVLQSGQAVRAGDLVTRLVSDTARIKAGLKGFLVHVATNGLLAAGVTLVVLWMDPAIGLVFVTAVLVTLFVTVLAAARIFLLAAKFRRKETQLADSIQEAAVQPWVEESFGVVNHSSGTHEAAITRAQGRTTWAVHLIIGSAVLGAVWAGGRSHAAGSLGTGDLLVLVMYGLMIIGPVVRLARQGARTGKILACLERLRDLAITDRSGSPAEASPTRRSPDRIVLEGITLGRPSLGLRKRRLGPVSLAVSCREKTAVIGPPGAGKSSLLHVLAAAEKPSKGTVRWDDEVVRPPHAGHAHRVTLVPHAPSWRTCRLGDFLGTEAGDRIRPSAEAVLAAVLPRSAMRALVDDPSRPVGSGHLSSSECLAFAAARVAQHPDTFAILDDPGRGLSRGKAGRLLRALLDGRGDFGACVALHDARHLDQFDRIVELDKGRVVFDGPPAEWLRTRASAQKKSRTPPSSVQPR